LRKAWKFAKPKDRKAASEGSEAQVTWPARVPKANGKVTSVENDVLIVENDEGSKRKVKLLIPAGKKKGKKKVHLIPCVAVNEPVLGEQQFVASVVLQQTDLQCNRHKSAHDFLSDQSHPEFTVRFTAARVLGHLPSKEALERLREWLEKENDPYVKLEIACSMARHGDEDGLKFLADSLGHKNNEVRFRTAIILGDIHDSESAKLLRDILADSSQHGEVRAVAARSLGRLVDTALEDNLGSLVKAFEQEDMQVRRKAFEAIVLAGAKGVPLLTAYLDTNSDPIGAGVAACLCGLHQNSLPSLLDALSDEKKRKWATVSLGLMDSHQVPLNLELMKTKETYETVAILRSIPRWVHLLF
jgi:hypothetical protein